MEAQRWTEMCRCVEAPSVIGPSWWTGARYWSQFSSLRILVAMSLYKGSNIWAPFPSISAPRTHVLTDSRC